MSASHVLLVHADPGVASDLAGGLAAALPPPTLAADIEEALPIVAEGPRVDLCLVDGTLASPLAMERLHRTDPELAIVAVVPRESPQDGAAAIRSGCSDYLLWPCPPDDLRALVDRSLEHNRLRREHSRLLAENIAVLHTQSLYRRCLDLLSTVDMEPLQELVLKVFCEMSDAQSAALWVRNERGVMVLRAHRGLWDSQSLPAQIDPSQGPLAARLEGGVPFARDGAADQSFYAPLCAGGEPVGLLLLADKLGGAFGAEDFGKARAVGDLAAVALRNARRYADLERGGLRDRDSPAYNLSYFIDYAGKELYKAHRYGRQFSLVTMRIDNLAQLRRRVDTGAVGEAVRALVTQLAGLIRDADILSKVAEDELYALLPETDRFGGMMFERRVRDMARRVEETAPDGRPPIAMTVGVATFPVDGGDFDELLARCRVRMDEARTTLRRRLHLDDLAFWETFEVLVDGRSAKAIRAREGGSGASHQGPLPEGHFAALQREICREIVRAPRVRGLVYVGTSEIDPDLPLLRELPAADFAARVYVLGRRGPSAVHHAVVTPVYLDGAPVAAGQAAHRHDFALYLAEHAAYAYLHRRGSPEATFHTSDRLLVDHLVSRLQQAYDLQPY